MDTKDFLVRLSPEEHAALRSFARVTDRSMNDVIKGALHEYLVGTGRLEFVRASAAQTSEKFEVLLEKLAN